MRTQICITIDTEFSIGGAFADPGRRQPIGAPNVTCEVAGREQGLGFLLDTFERYGTKATWFVEAMQQHWFGDSEMRPVTQRLLAAGQDVQLHLHPCWRAFRNSDWHETAPNQVPNDHCDVLGEAELQDMIGAGTAFLERCGVPRPVALRTGNLRASREIYRAMRACGLPLASNVGLALCQPEDPALHLHGGRHRIEGVLEVPVLTYAPGQRLFTTTACSSAETIALLRQARRQRVPTLVLLTHPFEFIKGDRLDPARQRRNRINQKRMERLCAFIAENPDEFEATTFAGAGSGWLAGPDVPEPSLCVPLPAVLARMIENKANDMVSAL